MTKSDVFNPLVCRRAVSALCQRCASVSSLKTSGRLAALFLFVAASLALSPTCRLVVSSLFPASRMSRASMTLLPGTRTVNKTGPIRRGVNSTQVNTHSGLLQGHIHTVYYSLTSPFKCFLQSSEARRVYSSSTATPNVLQQPLCLLLSTTIPSGRIYTPVLSHAIRADTGRSIFGYPGAPVPP